ncbi:MAG: rhamnulokinase, partial [Oscillospiraceae bacterium]|nr:rhamnulokinase [Oscillospiraceae bacterium]
QTEYTIASTSALIDANTRDWAWNLIDKAGIPHSLFTPISKPGTVVGDLNTDTLEDVGAIGAKVHALSSK